MPTQVVDIADLRPGQARMELWDGRPVLIYRRTETDIQQLQADDTRLLDFDSTESRQPSWAQNPYRSREPEWFVSIGVGTDFSCPVRHLAAASEPFLEQPWQGGFIDDCRGSRYDSAGRVYRGQYADENLIVPEYIRKDDVLILGG